MKIIARIIRWYSPKKYIEMGMARDRTKHEQMLKKATSASERNALESEFYQLTLRDWDEWLTSIKDAELIKAAKKMEIELDDFPLPEFDEDDLHAIKHSHFYYGEFGGRLLDPETRKSISKAKRERAPAYRKERREYLELIIIPLHPQLCWGTKTVIQ